MLYIVLLLLILVLIVKYNRQITSWANSHIEKNSNTNQAYNRKIKALEKAVAEFEARDKEVKMLEHRTFIEQKAHNVRLVVVIYVDSIKEPWPYKLKKELPLLKEAHKQVLSFFDSPYYSEIIKEAEFDLFYGDFKILGNKTRYKKFFAEYVHQPHSLNLHNIKKQMPDRYLEDFDESLFCI